METNLSSSGGTPNPKRCTTRRTADQTGIATNTWTNILFTTDDIDTDSMHDTGSNTDRITIQTAGTYIFGVSALWNNTGLVGTRGFRILNSGGGILAYFEVPAAAYAGTGLTTAPIVCSVSDYFTSSCYQSSGTNQDLLANGGVPTFWALQVA